MKRLLRVIENLIVKYQKKLFNLVKIKAVQMVLKSMQKKCKSKNIQLQQLLTQ